MAELEYILGTEDAELERLGVQHEVWVDSTESLWEQAGFQRGMRVLDLGSGPGFTTFDLWNVTGDVVAIDESERYLAHLEQEREKRSLEGVETRCVSVEEMQLEPEGFDGAYARWLFCWLEDPGALVKKVAAALKPGGRFVCQEYVNWRTTRMVPPCSAHAAAVDAIMQSWDTNIDAGEDMAIWAEQAGLRLVHAEPAARMGGPGSPVWSWVTGFFSIYLPKLVEKGLFTQAQLDAWHAAVAEHESKGVTRLLGPLMIELVFEKE